MTNMSGAGNGSSISELTDLVPSNVSSRPQYVFWYHMPSIEITVGFYILLAVIIIFGNSLVIVSFHWKPALRTKTNWYLVSLASADLMVGMVAIPFWSYILLARDFQHNNYYYSLDVLSGIASIMHLMAITIERFHAIYQPLHHRQVRKGVIFFSIIFIWITAILVSLPNVLLKKRAHLGKYALVLTVAFFICPLFIIIVAYVIIFIIARRHLIKRGHRSFKKDLRTASMIGIVIGCFGICWFPFFLTTVLIHFGDVRRNPIIVDFRSVLVVKMLHYANSACNPIIYATRHNEFRKTFKKLFHHVFGSEYSETRGDSVNSSKSKTGRSVSTFFRRQASEPRTKV